MREVFGIFTMMMEEMQRREFDFDLGEEFGKKKCRLLVFGDYEWLCKSLGHMGANSSYPCLWCKVQLEALRNSNGQPHSPMVKQDGIWVRREGWPADRTIQEMRQDLQNNKELVQRVGGTTKDNSSTYHSLHADPILPVTTDVDHIIPPSLHIMLGLTQQYFNMLENKVRILHSHSLENRNKDLHNSSHIS